MPGKVSIDPKLLAIQQKAKSMAKESTDCLLKLLKEVDAEAGHQKKIDEGFTKLEKAKA